MKRLHISEDVIPIAKFKSQASKIINSVKSDGRSVVITQQGEPVAVLITPEDFDNYVERDRFRSEVQTGLDDISSGRLIDDTKLDRIIGKHFDKSK